MKRYLEGDDGRGWEVMRKVTYEVSRTERGRVEADPQVPDEAALRGLGAKLDGLTPKLSHHLWIEQP